MRFPPPSLLSACASAVVFGFLATGSLVAQFEKEPQVAVFIEYIELEKADAFRLAQEHEGASSAGVLRATIEKRLDENRATLVESIYTRGRLGELVKVQSIGEFIYGSEGDPPEIPNEVKIQNVENFSEFRGTPGTFAAFETRNTGSEFEFEVNVGKGDITIELSAELNVLLFKHYFGRSPKMHPNSEIQHKSMPQISTLKVTNQYRVESGKPILVSLQKSLPYREERKAPEDDSKRVLIFLTVWTL